MIANKSTPNVAMKRIENFEKSRALASRAQELIPGGAHTYSKGADQFPFNSPGFIERADGSREKLAHIGQAEVRPGDIMVICTPGGGGYGVIDK